MARRERSIVEYFAEHERYRCGYCGSSDTNYSHGMWAHSMTVQDYQDLIDRGWRRSGKYCYKPTMNVTCCPMYTIRCEALNFKLSKSHKKVIKRVNRYLITGQKPGGKESGDDGEAADSSAEGPCGDSFVQGKQSKHSLSAGDIQNDRTSANKASNVTQQKKVKKTSENSAVDGEKTTTKKSEEKASSKSVSVQGQGPDESKPPCRKAKQLRLERKMQKTGLSLDEMKAKNKNQEGKTLEELLNEPLQAENPAHRLELKLVRSSPKSREFLETYLAAHKVYHKYQTVIHKDTPEKPNLKQYTRFLVDSPLEVKLVRTSPPSTESRLSFHKSYEVYRKYQMTIHKDEPHECGKDSYQEFLLHSPLEPVIPEEGEPGLPQGYGSFHQHYLLDGKLIAVGVVDILPHCISSVYLYYDPDYSFLSLGTYSALRELALVRELQKIDPALVHYYMGFYIHSCPKMRYKGSYFPSFLVCPESYNWIPLEQCIPKLEASPYARLSVPGKEDEDGRLNLDEVLVLFNREAMSYEVYKVFEGSNPGDGEEVKEYASLTGMTCARRMLLFRR